MLVAIVGATDQRKKTVGVGQPLDMEALKVKGLFRQREPSLWITEERERKKKQGSSTLSILWTYVLQILFCFAIPRSSLLTKLPLHSGKRKTENRMSPPFKNELILFPRMELH